MLAPPLQLSWFEGPWVIFQPPDQPPSLCGFGLSWPWALVDQMRPTWPFLAFQYKGLSYGEGNLPKEYFPTSSWHPEGSGWRETSHIGKSLCTAWFAGARASCCP